MGHNVEGSREHRPPLTEPQLCKIWFLINFIDKILESCSFKKIIWLFDGCGYDNKEFAIGY